MTISVAAPVGAESISQTGSIGIQDFLKILSAQLNNQDPLKPMDNQEFVAQIAQFASLEQSRQLNVKIDSMLSIQSSQQSIGLLGKTVDVNAQGNRVSGRVTALSLESGEPRMTITTANGQFLDNLALSQLINVR
jgi:flagellar basal-body rod modification protein FlgD